MVRSVESPLRAATHVLKRIGGRAGARSGARTMGSKRLGIALVAGAALALAPAAQAETTSYRISETKPWTQTVFSCTGEPVVLNGTYHFETNYRVTVDPGGTRFHSQELHKHSLRGTGVDSGAVYQNQQEKMSEQNGTFTLDPFSGGSGAYERTDVTNIVLIRQGETAGLDDLYVRSRSHITYNANGTVIPRPGTVEVICR